MLACGVDVSKATLDVAIHGSSQVRSFANSIAGFRKLAAWLLNRSGNPGGCLV